MRGGLERLFQEVLSMNRWITTTEHNNDGTRVGLERLFQGILCMVHNTAAEMAANMAANGLETRNELRQNTKAVALVDEQRMAEIARVLEGRMITALDHRIRETFNTHEQAQPTHHVKGGARNGNGTHRQSADPQPSLDELASNLDGMSIVDGDSTSRASKHWRSMNLTFQQPTQNAEPERPAAAPSNQGRDSVSQVGSSQAPRPDAQGTARCSSSPLSARQRDTKEVAFAQPSELRLGPSSGPLVVQGPLVRGPLVHVQGPPLHSTWTTRDTAPLASPVSAALSEGRFGLAAATSHRTASPNAPENDTDLGLQSTRNESRRHSGGESPVTREEGERRRSGKARAVENDAPSQEQCRTDDGPGQKRQQKQARFQPDPVKNPQMAVLVQENEQLRRVLKQQETKVVHRLEQQGASQRPKEKETRAQQDPERVKKLEDENRLLRDGIRVRDQALHSALVSSNKQPSVAGELDRDWQTLQDNKARAEQERLSRQHQHQPGTRRTSEAGYSSRQSLAYPLASF